MSSTNTVEEIVTKPPDSLTAGDAKTCVNSWLCRGADEIEDSSGAAGKTKIFYKIFMESQKELQLVKETLMF